MNRIVAFLLPVVLSLSAFSSASAQEEPEYVLSRDQTQEKNEDDCVCAEKKVKPKKPPSEWDFKLRFGSMFQLSANNSVIGKLDGTSRSIGFDAHFEANWKRERNEVRNPS